MGLKSDHIADFIAPNATPGDRVNVVEQPRTGRPANTSTEYTKQPDGDWKPTATRPYTDNTPSTTLPGSSK